MRLNKKEFADVTESILIKINPLSEKMQALVSKWNINQSIFTEFVNILTEINDQLLSLKSDWDDMDLDTLNMDRISQRIFDLIINFEKNSLGLITTNSEEFQSDFDKIMTDLEFSYTVFGIKKPAKKITSWSDDRLQIEQQLLTDLELGSRLDVTLHDVKKFSNKLQSISKNLFYKIYIFCATDEHRNIQEKHEKWTPLFITTLTRHLKQTGISVDSSISCSDIGSRPDQEKKDKISLLRKSESQHLFIIGTQSLLASMEQFNSSTAEETIYISRKINEGVNVLSILLSGTRESSLPNASHLDLQDYSILKDEECFLDIRSYSYVQTLKLLIARAFNLTPDSSLYDEFESCWTNLEHYLKIPREGIPKEFVMSYLDMQKNNPRDASLLLNNQRKCEEFLNKSFKENKQVNNNVTSSRTQNVTIPRQPNNSNNNQSSVRSISSESNNNAQKIQKEPILSENTLDDYSKTVKAYINSFKNKDKNTDTLKDIILTDEEEDLLEKYRDSLTTDVVNIPVTLNERLYDLETLLKVFEKDKKDPFSRDEFTLRDIQSARTIADELNTIIVKIVNAHKNEGTNNQNVQSDIALKFKLEQSTEKQLTQIPNLHISSNTTLIIPAKSSQREKAAQYTKTFQTEPKRKITTVTKISNRVTGSGSFVQITDQGTTKTYQTYGTVDFNQGKLSIPVPQRTITLSAMIDVRYGYTLYISGENLKLGSWVKAQAMHCTLSNYWQIKLPLEVLDSSFKFLIGPTPKPYEMASEKDTQHLTWENGTNRQIKEDCFIFDKSVFNLSHTHDTTPGLFK